MFIELLDTRILPSMIALCIGFALDLCFGDPHWMPHPIRFIGNLIDRGELLLRSVFPKTQKGEFIGGMVLVICIIGISTAIPYLILWAAGKVHIILRIAIESFMCYQILSVKALKTESMKVFHELYAEDLEGARDRVSMIVGRDVEGLNQEGIIKATLETVAENTSDGTVAPLLFMAIGGGPLGFLYKSINTMDSMIGYKNEQYLNFGKFAAKVDDIVNYIPARVSAYFMIIVSYLLKLDYKNAYKIFKRDRYNHASPNSAQTESVCAGALQIQLAGDAYYFGKLYRKKTIGDPIRRITYHDIEKVNRLLYETAYLTLILCLTGMGVATWLI